MSTSANREEPDEMQHKTAFHLGLHCKCKTRSSDNDTIFFLKIIS